MGPPSQRSSLQHGCQDFCVSAAVKCAAESAVAAPVAHVTPGPPARTACPAPQLPRMLAHTWDGPLDGPPAPVIEFTTRFHGCPAFCVCPAFQLPGQRQGQSTPCVSLPACLPPTTLFVLSTLPRRSSPRPPCQP